MSYCKDTANLIVDAITNSANSAYETLRYPGDVAVERVVNYLGNKFGGDFSAIASDKDAKNYIKNRVFDGMVATVANKISGNYNGWSTNPLYAFAGGFSAKVIYDTVSGLLGLNTQSNESHRR